MHEKYEIESEIGSGTYAVVYKGYLKTDKNVIIALKRLKKR